MRRIVKCSQCSRRYDASSRKVGSRFRCRCGETLTVLAAKSHEAEVVRCSSCGGPREQNSRQCGFCHADFTIHEQDLNTVCPQCLARVSDKARFCCQCGSPLIGEDLAGDESKLACPACGDSTHLSSRRLGKENLAALECATCAGLWVGHDSFALLQERVVQQAAENTRTAIPPPPIAAAAPQAGPRYRACVYCGKLMQRRSFGKGSGVIIDTCRQHGIWFDDQELQHILQWLAAGGRGTSVRGEAADQLGKEPVKTSRSNSGKSSTTTWPGVGTSSLFEVGAEFLPLVLRFLAANFPVWR